MNIPRNFWQETIYTINLGKRYEKHLIKELKLKTNIKILAKKNSSFRAKLDCIDNDFNKWLEEKVLKKEFNNNTLSERQKNLKNINKQLEEVWKNNIQGKINVFEKAKQKLVFSITYQLLSLTQPTQIPS